MNNRELFGKIENFELGKMLLNQLNSLKLTLLKKDLSEKTVDRKIKDVCMFFCYLDTLRKSKQGVYFENINKIAFDYVANGYFNVDNLDNFGTIGYRRSIYYNISEGFNYIYEDKQDIIIEELTSEQIELLDSISKNKWFRCAGKWDKSDIDNSIQTQLIESLGIKVYFDEAGKPYVYSHELSENLKIENKEIRRKIDKMLKDLDGGSFHCPLEHSVFKVSEDFYKNSQNKQQATYRIYKDMLYLLLMDTSAQGSKRLDILQFKMKYIDAFNFIEQEHNRLLEEHAKLKENFLNMYNEMRKQNRDLLINNREGNLK